LADGAHSQLVARTLASSFARRAPGPIPAANAESRVLAGRL